MLKPGGSARKPGKIVQGQPIAPRTLVFAKEMRRAMTPEERLLWSRLRQNLLSGLHFRRQQIICGFIVDFYCDAARLAVELDGAGHDAQYDAHRDCDLARVDIKVSDSEIASSEKTWNRSSKGSWRKREIESQRPNP